MAPKKRRSSRSARRRSRRGDSQARRHERRSNHGNSIEDVRIQLRDALQTIGPRHFTMRELRSHVPPGTSTADVQRAAQALVRGGYLGLDVHGYRMTHLGWTWVEGAERRGG